MLLVGVVAALPLLLADDAAACVRRIPPHERIAFCFNGVARTLDYGVTYKSYERMTAAFGGTPTLFMYLKLVDSIEHEGLERRHVDAAALEDALRFWRVERQNVRVVSGGGVAANCTAGKEGGACRICGRDAWRLLVEQVRATERCFGLIEDYERDRGVTFDWVVHARPDIAWFGAALDDASTCFNRTTVYTTSDSAGFQDWVMFGGRAVAAPLFKRFSAAHNCSRPVGEMPLDQWVAVGGGLEAYFREHETRMARVESPLVLVRPNVNVRTVKDICLVKQQPLEQAHLNCASFYNGTTGLPREDPPPPERRREQRG